MVHESHLCMYIVQYIEYSPMLQEGILNPLAVLSGPLLADERGTVLYRRYHPQEDSSVVL